MSDVRNTAVSVTQTDHYSVRCNFDDLLDFYIYMFASLTHLRIDLRTYGVSGIT